MSADQNTTLIRRWFDEVCNGRKLLVKVRNGKIVESYDVWDTLGMLQQLGVVPQMR